MPGALCCHFVQEMGHPMSHLPQGLSLQYAEQLSAADDDLKFRVAEERLLRIAVPYVLRKRIAPRSSRQVCLMVKIGT